MIGPEAEQLGVVILTRALDLAQKYSLDLVEIAPMAKPPVCRIMDYSKFKYDQEKKERRIRKNQHVQHLKQIRLMPNIGEGDYKIKLRQIVNFLQKKDKVKVNMFYRGREMQHRELGLAILNRVMKDTVIHGQAEKAPTLEGRVMSVVIAPGSGKSQGAEKENQE